ncbi:hypothetical protein NDU88_007012, partial [Pleurodeles waltl]
YQASTPGTRPLHQVPGLHTRYQASTPGIRPPYQLPCLCTRYEALGLQISYQAPSSVIQSSQQVSGL